jgi:predicted house-cleaning noncanonical NTP pyrophosphatase (MazG superfamily)
MNILEILDLIKHLFVNSPQDTELIDYYTSEYNKLWNELKEEINEITQQK